MNDQELEQALEKAHEENGYCQSCGWHASFHDMEYEATGEIIDGKQEWEGSCQSKDDDDRYSHRGCYIYVDVKDE